MLSACAASIKFAPHAVTFRTVIRFTGKAPHVSSNDCIYYFTSDIISKSVFKSQESNFKKVAQKNNRLLLTPFHLPLPSFFAARPCTFHPKMLYSRQIKSAVSIAPAAAAKRHISLCGCVHNFILSVSLFNRQYRMDLGKESILP